MKSDTSIPPLPLPQLYQLAVEHYSAGRLAEAEAVYREILRQRPEIVEVRNDLGVVLAARGQTSEAIEHYRKALAVRPNFPEAWNNLANSFVAGGKLEEAIEAYRKALSSRSKFPQAALNLAGTQRKLGRLNEAIESYQLAITLQPTDAPSFNVLGDVFRQAGRNQEAVGAFERAIALKPGYADAYNNLGGALSALERREEAIEAYRQALSLQPDMVAALYNLATSLQEHGELGEAVKLHLRALELRPDFPEAWANLATAYKYAGQLDESIECHHRALSLKPDPIVADNLLLTIHFHPDYDPRRIREEHDRWNEIYARPLRRHIRPHSNDRSPNCPLKVAFVSPDLRMHPVGRFLLPLFEHHDRRRLEITCYSDAKRLEPFSEVLRSNVNKWRDTSQISDEDFCEVVRADGIDVLVDLAMHLQYNRILAFARKPAPVQVTYLAYCSTTGLETMDYRLSDPYLDPPGMDESVYIEKTVRLARTYWCYPAPAEAPMVGPAPAFKEGHISFGCLNNYAKVTRETLDLWGQLLARVPNSTLTMSSPHGGHRQQAREQLSRYGVDPDRLYFVALTTVENYLAMYQRIDIALDPFPYAGGTTTCDALWMGVPVVSLTGKTAVSRGGLSILSNVGLSEFVAHDPNRYIQIAIELANDLSRLKELRATLRPKMQSSPLMDGPAFARDFEAALRQMWHNWCASGA